MTSPELTRITRQNKEIINFTTKSHPLSDAQLAQLESFSTLDDEWRMLMVIGDHYAGMGERTTMVDAQRNEQILSNPDPVLGAAIRKYIELVEVAQFENEP